MSGPGFRVLVCGGRHYRDHARVYAKLDRLQPNLVIEGGGSGADGIARMWAANNGVPLATFAAHWDKFGKAAGPLRNGWMLKYGQPDLVLAFPGGKGTADMVRQAKAADIEVEEATA